MSGTLGTGQLSAKYFTGAAWQVSRGRAKVLRAADGRTRNANVSDTMVGDSRTPAPPPP